MRFKKIVDWLKKYAVWIAIAQAILWPLSIGTSMYWNYTTKDMVPMMFNGDAVVLEMLRGWQWSRIHETDRSQEECEYWKENDVIGLRDDVDCSDIETEGGQLAFWIELYNIKDRDAIQHILRTLYGQSENVPDSVKRLVGDIE